MKEFKGNKIFIPKIADRNPKNGTNSIKAQLEWIKRQLEYSEFSNEYKTRISVKKGEIYEIDWGVNVNAEFSNRHYGVVLRDSNEYDPLVLVCPLKTNRFGGHPASDIDLGYVEDLQSDHKTLAVVNQIRSVDKMRIFSTTMIGDGDVFSEEIPKLSDKKVEIILTAYYNFMYGQNIQ